MAVYMIYWQDGAGFYHLLVGGGGFLSFVGECQISRRTRPLQDGKMLDKI